jgi:hypothetical protein
MEINELKQLYFLKKEIERNKRRLSEMRELMKTVKSVTDYSRERVQTSVGNESSVERIILEIIELQEMLNAQNIQLILLERKIERYIEAIDDAQTRLMFKLRFIDCKRWENVAEEIGGGNTADSCRMTCVRFLKKNK